MKIQPIQPIPSISQHDRPIKVNPVEATKPQDEQAFKLELDKVMQKKIQEQKNPQPLSEN